MKTPDDWKRARVTLGIAGVTAVAWLLASATGYADAAAVWGGFVPARLSGAVLDGAPALLTPLTATLVHAGLVHLAFNLIMLLFCGRAVEGIIGPAGFGILYVVGAFVAAAAHFAFGPNDQVPMIGASGAISAVLGAYAMLFGRNRVKIAHPTLALWVNALWLMAAWIGLQLLTGVTFDTAGNRSAIVAHIGGFLAGLLLARPLLLFRYRKA